MELLYYRECSPQKVSELNYLMMRLTDTMQDIEVATMRIKDKYQADSEEFNTALSDFIDEYEGYLKNIIVSIISRYFPEMSYKQVIQ